MACQRGGVASDSHDPNVVRTVRSQPARQPRPAATRNKGQEKRPSGGGNDGSDLRGRGGPGEGGGGGGLCTSSRSNFQARADRRPGREAWARKQVSTPQPDGAACSRSTDPEWGEVHIFARGRVIVGVVPDDNHPAQQRRL